MSLTSAQRKYLRGLGHHLDPVVTIGQQGVTPAVEAALDEALGSHELVKLRFREFKQSKAALCAQLAQACSAELVGRVGHVAIFFRAATVPEERKIELPR